LITHAGAKSLSASGRAQRLAVRARQVVLDRAFRQAENSADFPVRFALAAPAEAFDLPGRQVGFSLHDGARVFAASDCVSVRAPFALPSATRRRISTKTYSKLKIALIDLSEV
jgi:hypothetical protein